jgi:hypothetical protein
MNRYMAILIKAITIIKFENPNLVFTINAKP